MSNLKSECLRWTLAKKLWINVILTCRFWEDLQALRAPTRRPTRRTEVPKREGDVDALWPESKRRESGSGVLWFEVPSSVHFCKCKIFCPHVTLNSIMSCLHFRDMDSLSRAQTQTLLQEDINSPSHSTPFTNRSSRKRVSKIDVRGLNVSTFVFFLQFQNFPRQRTVLAHSYHNTICQKATLTSQGRPKKSLRRGPSSSAI